MFLLIYDCLSILGNNYYQVYLFIFYFLNKYFRFSNEKTPSLCSLYYKMCSNEEEDIMDIYEHIYKLMSPKIEDPIDCVICLKNYKESNELFIDYKKNRVFYSDCLCQPHIHINCYISHIKFNGNKCVICNNRINIFPIPFHYLKSEHKQQFPYFIYFILNFIITFSKLVFLCSKLAIFYNAYLFYFNYLKELNFQTLFIIPHIQTQENIYTEIDEQENEYYYEGDEFH